MKTASKIAIPVIFVISTAILFQSFPSKDEVFRKMTPERQARLQREVDIKRRNARETVQKIKENGKKEIPIWHSK